MAKPSSAQEMLGATAGRVNVHTAAIIISPASVAFPEKKSEIVNRLTELGYVVGAFLQWTKSGTTVSIFLLQFYDGAGATSYADDARKLREPGGMDLASMDKGRWYQSRDNRAYDAVFSRGGIAVEIQVRLPEAADASQLLSLAEQQYVLLPDA